MNKILEKWNLKEKLNNKLLIIFIISILATIFFCFPYINKYSIEGHDLGYHLTRIQQISEGIVNWNIPVIIHSSLLNGAGYANSIFYPELFLYFPALLHAIGISTVTSYKIFTLAITWVTFISMYICAKKISKSDSIAMLATFLYTFCLYRIVDVYTRAALGEVLAFIFIPIVILGCYELIYEGKKDKWWIIPLGIFGIANSHIISSVFAVGIILYFILVNLGRIFKNKKIILSIILSGLISILIVTSVFVPMIEQVLNADYKVFKNENDWELDERTLMITQIFLDNYTNLNEAENPIQDKMNLSIGIMLLLLPVLMLICKNSNEEKKFINQLFALGLLLMIAITNIFPWKYFEMFNFIQVPWRLNLVISAVFAIVGSYAFYYVIKQNKKEFTIILLIVIALVTSRYLNSISYSPYLNSEEVKNDIGTGEYLPQGLSMENLEVYNISNKDVKYNYTKEYNKLETNLTDNEVSKAINIPLLYYKGYVANLKDKEGRVTELELKENKENGQVIVSSDKNIKGNVTVEYKMTLVQKISYAISAISLIVVLYNLIKCLINKLKNRK